MKAFSCGGNLYTTDSGIYLFCSIGLGPWGSAHENNLRRSYDWTELVAEVSHGTGRIA